MLFRPPEWFERHFKYKLDEIHLKRSLLIKYKLKLWEKVKTPEQKERMTAVIRCHG